MNVYDFDGTMFPGDCAIGFCFWCMNRHPRLWFTFFPKAVKILILNKKGKMPEYLMQRKFFGYLMLIDDFDEQIERYWNKNEKKIAAWYLAQKRADTTFVNIGAGCTRPGDTHIYVGTSGWVSTYLDYQTVDINAMITGVLSAKHGYYNYYAELETAGKCFEWVMDHLALDEVGIYLEKRKVTDVESKYVSLYDYLSEEVSKVPPGANGVIFTPWIHGNRCPFEDANAAGMFFNIRIENGKRDMIRAVLEGICYHLRWLLECEAKKVKTSDTIRFDGGGALSPVTCQMLADITGRTIETVPNTQEVGAIGAALTVAAGIKGEDVLDLSRKLIKANHTYIPNPGNKEIYDRNYKVFRKLYKANATLFEELNHYGRGFSGQI